MTATEINPGLLIIAAGVLAAFLPRLLRQIFSLGAPLAGIALIWATPIGTKATVSMFGYSLTLLRLDALAFPFALIFMIAGILNAIYALHQDDRMQDSAAMIYGGAAVGATLAGDLATLFIYWELTAVSSVFLILASGTERAYRASMRYLIWQIGSGVLLLGGILMHWRATGSLEFTAMKLAGPAAWMIFIAFGIKCAFPLLHNWLQDAYPEATVTGTVVLSAFTTKLAVYAFARTFAGESLLIPIGAVMTCFPVFFAVIENDLRRVLAFSLNNQLGFMLVGIGLGSQIAINGAVSHAFAHIIYKALLFMSMGAVLYRTGTVKASELGGLHKSMPWTTVFCIIGALSIAGFPLTSGFVTKNLTLAGAENAGYFMVWLLLIFASAGVMEHSGIKIPYFAFFSHDGGHRVKEAPWNMLLAMGLCAFACIFIGIFPQTLYSILPYPVTKNPFDIQSVVTKTQLLFFSILAFALLIRTGLYPKEIPSTNLNTDWFYRKFGAYVLLIASRVAAWAWSGVEYAWRYILVMIERYVHKHYGPDGAMGRSWATGLMAFWATVMIAAYSLIGYYYYR
ncbi:MAG: Na(+)/H(+) antiporter subunit D [Hyphomicrobiales bacterium]|nr:Na(+)/H(+) antiporter subunit D [Hyphomicrobiales bacterium]